MDTDIIHANLSNVKEMILDEEKLVTYLSLSIELCLHVNESKILLKQAVEDIRKNQPELKLNINYIVSGLYENNAARTTICSEIELSTVRDAFLIVFFEHIYSVSKGIKSGDNTTILAINRFENLTLYRGLVKSNLCIKRTADEIGVLKSSSQNTVVIEQKPTNAPQTKVQVKKDTSSNGDVDKNIKVLGSESEPIIKEVFSPKKALPINNKQKLDSKKNVSKTQKGIAGFFTKAASHPSAKQIKLEPKIELDIKRSEELVVKTENEDKKLPNNFIQSKNGDLQVCNKNTHNSLEKMDVDDNMIKIAKNEDRIDRKEKTVNNKSLKKIKKNAKIDKKRKRLLLFSDSESDDEKNDPFMDVPVAEHESEDEISPTPFVNTFKITSGIVNAKKKRKIVDKTYTDEDGYILTKKEEVFESCSENEEELNVKENIKENAKETKQNKVEISPKGKNGAKNNKKKIQSPQKGKQAILTSFFKKI